MGVVVVDGAGKRGGGDNGHAVGGIRMISDSGGRDTVELVEENEKINDGDNVGHKNEVR